MAEAWSRGCVIAVLTAWLAPGWVSRYERAAPVAELTVLARPLALQSGAALAVGAPIIAAATPPSRPDAQIPAIPRRAVIPVNFMIISFWVAI